MKKNLMNITKRFLSYASMALALLMLFPGGPLLANGDKVKIGINTQDNYGSAYVTWAPVKAWARLVSPGSADVLVELTNDAGSVTTTPAGKRADGDFAFSAQEPPQGQTATQSVLKLRLPKNGDPVLFYLAGKFPQASTKDGDAIIEVHAADGTLLDRRKAMVRVRKEFKTLTEDEQTAFLVALNTYQENNGQQEYLKVLAVHNWAARGKFPTDPFPKYPSNSYRYPDQAHGGSAFIAWHRAFLLELERALQKINPSVALPYWPSNQSTAQTEVFTVAGMGAVTGNSGATVIPTFDDGHPFEDWRMPNADDPSVFEPIQRSAWDPTQQFSPRSDKTIVRRGTYNRFASPLESNPHNQGHNFTGPWMANCRVSPRDPVFWVFHTWFDKMWAQWQYTYGRFTRTEDDYSPTGSFNPSGSIAKGHYIDDTMWPWNDEIGEQTNELASRPPVKLTGPFKSSGVEDIWPGIHTATPDPGDLIDYLGVNSRNLRMGFSYDTVPFGTKADAALHLSASKDEGSQSPLSRTFTSKSASLKSRRQALMNMNVRTNKEHANIINEIVNDTQASDAFRSIALSHLAEADSPDSVETAANILVDDEDGGETLDVHAVHTLNFMRMFNVLDNAEQKQTDEALHDALDDERPAVKSAALRVLAVSRDTIAVDQLKAHLQGKAKRVLGLPSTIHLLASAEAKKSHQHIRPFINSENVDVRIAAITHLGSDAKSIQAITALLNDPKEPYKARSAAVGALLFHDKNFANTTLVLMNDNATPERLKRRLRRALQKHISDLNPTGLSDTQREAIRKQF